MSELVSDLPFLTGEADEELTLLNVLLVDSHDLTKGIFKQMVSPDGKSAEDNR